MSLEEHQVLRFPEPYNYKQVLHSSTLLQILVELRPRGASRSRNTSRRAATTAIPYTHVVSHCLKKTAGKAVAHVVFPAPNKLGAWCEKVNRTETKRDVCRKKQAQQFTGCAVGDVCEISLSCGINCMGLNEHPQEHKRSLDVARSGNLVIHVATRG
ncbi:hypothetical protein HPB50_008371 [Hyalomma asiaticum]|uniref:Uncharacterized protein n=1 Tax=Hyalomma asiaticum TaxID=266040 RepID=A0ACB7TKN2_HYAAI|nr:hypothetical protein HPB50_008371 [Hyalomma asiaticum]